MIFLLHFLMCQQFPNTSTLQKNQESSSKPLGLKELLSHASLVLAKEGKVGDCLFPKIKASPSESLRTFGSTSEGGKFLLTGEVDRMHLSELVALTTALVTVLPTLRGMEAVELSCDDLQM